MCGFQALAPLARQRDQFVEVEAFDAMLALQRGVLLGQDAGELAAQDRAVEQILHADADAPRPVGVRRPDAAARRPHRRLRESSLHRAVKGDVVRHDHVGVLADADPIYFDASAGQHVQFADQGGGIDDHAIADDRRDVRI